jgi:uncharacterized damage-inducible protein DinB
MLPEDPMSIADAALPEFDQEMANTRKLLERVPAAHTGWKPHAKSWAMGDLALHLANLPMWTTVTLKQTELDLNPPGGPGFTPPVFTNMTDALKMFDENVTTARAAIAGASDADFMVPWTLKNGGKAVFSLPRVVVFRSFVMNHMIHHRGQLTVYLRLKDVPLPSIYGPSADDTGGM